MLALLALGWAIARDIGRVAGPTFFRRMDPGTAGTVGFLVRLVTVGITLLVALEIAGVSAASLVATSAFTAVILGLAAQQTLGNLFAGMVLLSARPFRVGERVRLSGGRRRRTDRRDRQLARAALHDARPGRGPHHGAEQRRAVGRGGPDQGARAGRRQGPAWSWHPCEPGPGDPRRPRSRRRRGDRRGSCSNSSTGTTWSCGFRRRRTAPTTARAWPTRSSMRWRR